MKRIPASVAAAVLATSLQALAHGGGLDASGCHHNRKTGDYHCHRAQPEPVRSPSSQAAADALQDERRAAAAPGAPTCHVGPRGGTYTITASGRKNYAGC
ncbi:YHYH domain-containing protein [Azohydromonas aeria]|uniref:YHYH domain-containing protein n=1 Tax=Azohydromonas aeria TaxID=2590212 RepID=UPI0012FA944E|nr:YHYH domain-containing protein [Azohydromonas aeria]